MPPLKAAVQVDLYFGRDTDKGEVSESDWANFLADEVTPRFPGVKFHSNDYLHTTALGYSDIDRTLADLKLHV